MRKKYINIGYKISIELAVLSLILIILDYFNIFRTSFYINFTYFELLSGSLLFFFGYNKFKKNKVAKTIFPYFFLITIGFIIINQIYYIDIINKYIVILYFTSIITGIISFIFNIEIIKQIEKEQKIEKQKAEKLKHQFQKKKKLNLIIYPI